MESSRRMQRAHFLRFETRSQAKKEIPLCKLAWYKGQDVEVPIRVSGNDENEEEFYKQITKEKKKHKDWRMSIPTLKERISYLCFNEMFSDFIISCKLSQDRHFPVHRFILALRSCYFQTLFYGTFQSSGEHTVDAAENTVEKSLRFIYTDTDPNFHDLSELSEVMSFADMYMISPLSAVCENHAIEILDSDNACEFFQTAYMLNLPNLKEICLEYYDRNFKGFLSSPYFVSLNQGVVLTLYDAAVKTNRKVCFTPFLIKWCRSELKRKGKPDCDLPSELEPFIRLHGNRTSESE